MDIYAGNGCAFNTLLQKVEQEQVAAVVKEVEEVKVNVFELTSEKVKVDQEYYTGMAAYFLVNAQMKEAQFVFDLLENPAVYKAEVALHLLIITGDLK